MPHLSTESRMFPVATCCLLLPNVEYRVVVPCDCLKFFKNFQVELEKLNAATDEINKLELELDVSFFCYLFFILQLN